ncbi:MAG: GAF domain-containing protein, partial [Bacteroidales bacterium]
DSGLVGAAYTLNQIQLITDIPDDYFRINSGLGSAAPKNLLLTPLTFDNQVLGVVELASFNALSQAEIDLVEKVAYNVANNIHNVVMNEQNIKLINQFKESSRQMQENEERMRQNLEELEIIREQYEMLRNETVHRN